MHFALLNGAAGLGEAAEYQKSSVETRQMGRHGNLEPAAVAQFANTSRHGLAPPPSTKNLTAGGHMA